MKRAFVGAFGTSSAKEGRGFVWVRHWQTPTVWRGLFSPVALASAIIQGIDAWAKKRGHVFWIAIFKIETSTTRRFEDNRLNCNVAEPDF